MPTSFVNSPILYNIYDSTFYISYSSPLGPGAAFTGGGRPDPGTLLAAVVVVVVVVVVVGVGRNLQKIFRGMC